MSDETIGIGGNTVKLWYGKLLRRISNYYTKRSEKLIAKGNKTFILNPTCKFINPFTLIISFTVNNTDKYQLITEGKYKELYKECKEKEIEVNPIGTSEMFELIKMYQDKWYLKE